jgi:pimeloyl-ACP methyl ester carboxylesterase
LNEGKPPGHRGILVFSHANGFPALTYRLLFEAWADHGYTVLYVPMFGHNPAYPVTSNWPHLRDELLHLIDTEAAGQRVHLVGHSMGGYISLLAASRRPQVVKSVLLLDAPIVTGWRAHSLHVAKMTGLAKRFSPGRVSGTRRWQWPSEAAALEHFAKKKAFAAWDPRVLADYIHSGTEPDLDAATPGAVQLRFKREVETRIYNTLPHHLGPLLAKHPPGGPVVFIGGTRSAEVHQAGLEGTKRLVRERLEWITGGHLFPMERPRQTAAAVMRALA